MGTPDFVTFTNVFAHIEDLSGVLSALKLLIGPQTSIVIENHYLGAVLDRHQFDTFYHEHPRTYSYRSFDFIAKSLGLDIVHVEFPARYGGNIRVILGRGPQSSAAPAVIARERSFQQDFAKLARDVELWKERKGRALREIVAAHGPIRAKAFPGRAAILIKLLGLDEKEIVAVHEKPGSIKIGHYVPGTRIPIVSDDDLFALGPQTAPLLNLAWHISGEIRQYLSDHGYRRADRRHSQPRRFSCMRRFTILGSGFGLYGYLPALLGLGHKIALPERYRSVVGTRQELSQFVPRVDWCADIEEALAGSEAVVVALRPADQARWIPRLVRTPNIRQLILEKPIAPAPEVAASLLAELEGAGKRYRVGYTFRAVVLGAAASIGRERGKYGPVACLDVHGSPLPQRSHQLETVRCGGRRGASLLWHSPRRAARRARLRRRLELPRVGTVEQRDPALASDVYGTGSPSVHRRCR